MSLSDLSITRLKGSIKGDIVTPNDTSYTAAIARWSRLAERQAAAVVFVRDEDDVASAIKFAREHGLELAVKGGGHNTSGASSSEGGIVVDLSRYINTVKVNLSNKTVTVGGGAIWKNVDDATYPHGYAAVSGTVNDTGVGGLTLGGGFGILSGRHGLVIDNLIGATMVLADGSIVAVDDQSNRDLLWGIRGGGVNFGVVTSFVMVLHPVPLVCWSGALMFSLNKMEAVLDAVNTLKSEERSSDTCGLLGIIRNAGGSNSLMVACGYLGPAFLARKHYERLFEIGPDKDNTSEKPYPELNVDNDVPAGRYYHYTSGTVGHITRKMVEGVSHAQAKLAAEVPNVQPFVGIEFYPTKKICSIPNTATAFSGRSDRSDRSNFFVDINWEEGERDLGKVRYHGRAIAAALHGESQSENELFGSYEADVTGEERAKRVFGENYPRLQALKAKYDPDMIFSKWFPITPA